MTALESMFNVGSGMLIAFSISQFAAEHQELIQTYIWRDFIWNMSATSNLIMTVILTVLSVFRGYIWRRVFNHHHAKKLHETFKTIANEEK